MSRRSYESSVILLSVFLYFLITLPVCAKEDVSQTKKDITVYHYDKDLNVFPDTVLECLWIAGKMMCLTHPGYEFNNNVTDHLIVRIPQVSENYTGRYSCQMSGTRVQDIDFCRFDLNRELAYTGQDNLAASIAAPVAIMIVLLVVFVGICHLKRVGYKDGCRRTNLNYSYRLSKSADSLSTPRTSNDTIISNGSSSV